MFPLKIIFQDESLIILDKPPDLVVDRAETTKGMTLEDLLLKDVGNKLPRGGIVHRLDKDTSGLIMVAKTPKALENLQDQFKKRLVKKKYLALVHGFLMESGVVEGAIARNPKNREKFTVIPGGREAVTQYEILERLQFTDSRLQEIFSDFNKIQFRKLQTMNYQPYTLLAVRPKTGRTHQIRVHLKYIGRPIVADEKYAGRKVYRLDKRWCPRLFLNAAKIGFYHPSSGKWMELESPMPEDLKQVLDKLDPE
ncbi:RluA family pseudouridine synthase [Candidatus Daviesbacteria bacterium]|nr:RluA family pseudouridine synthase [Candidatus Daviesbacteria bacterium]